MNRRISILLVAILFLIGSPYISSAQEELALEEPNPAPEPGFEIADVEEILNAMIEHNKAIDAPEVNIYFMDENGQGAILCSYGRTYRQCQSVDMIEDFNAYDPPS